MSWGDAREPISVTNLTLAIQGLLQETFRGVWVAGQVSGLSRPRSGHIYLSLKDEGAVIKAVAWRGIASRIPFEIEDGQEVIARGDIDVYPPQGNYQLIIRELVPRGIGALELAFRQRFEQLSAEGLFDERLKRPLPRFPRRIAFVTSPSGAAIRDFLRIVGRRWPLASVLVIPAKVQGAAAAGDLVRGIEAANQLRGDDRPDLLVVGRGGGSLEDLWCFNEEAVVRAVRASAIPTVSAVGHEIDVCLTDLAADLRAATPSEAAERIVPSIDELTRSLVRCRQTLSERLMSRADEARQRLELLATRPVLLRPLDRLRMLSQQLDGVERRLELASDSQLKRLAQQVLLLREKLGAVSPYAVLARGYAIVSRETDSGTRPLGDLAQVPIGQPLRIQVADGSLRASVTEPPRLDPPQGEATE
ncbi:MAG: exodeoxyribonuclease VII large subunit [Planctomycetales bacterium]|nr:exodeoxyribonuclease VII large subunit [Planctomycetales bacterium]